MSNVDLDISKGTYKRMPSIYVSSIATDVSAANAFVHTFVADEDTWFFQVFDGSGVKVYDQSGVEQTVTFLDSSSYVSSTGDSQDPRDVLQTLTLGDGTVILRKDKVVSKSATLSDSLTLSAGYLFFKQTQYGKLAYRWYFQDDEDDTTKRRGYLTTAATVDSADDDTYNGWYVDSRADTGNLAGYVVKTCNEPNAGEANTQWNTFNSNASATWHGSICKLYKLDGTNIGSLDSADGLGDKGMSVIWKSVKSLDDLPVSLDEPGFKVRVEGNRSDLSDDYYVEFTETGFGTVEGQVENSTSGDLSTINIEANNIGYWKETVGPQIPYTWDFTTLPHALIRRPDGTFIYKQMGGDFTLNVSSSSDGTNNFVSSTGNTFNTSASPHSFVNGDRVVFTNDANDAPSGITEDVGYFVVGVSDSSSFQISDTLGGTALSLSDDGTGDNTITCTTYDAFKFADRTVGDDVSNPYPAFEGNTINSMALYRNRLAFISRDTVTLSEFGEFFNVFRLTVQEVLDSAPIEVATTDNKTRELTNAVSFKNKLLVFSKDGQFILQGEPALTPQTVSFTLATSYTSNERIAPFVVGDRLYFLETKGANNKLQELKEVTFVGNFKSFDISVDVPDLLTGVVEFIANNGSDKIALVSDADLGKVIVLTVVEGPDGARLISAWHTYTFDDFEVEGMEYLDNTLYLIGSYQGRHRVLLTHDLEVDTTQPFLDNRISDTILATPVYTAGTNTTKYLMPFTLSSFDGYKAVRDDLFEYNISGTDTSSITVEGDTTSKVLDFGTLYESKIEMSKFFPQSRQGTGTVANDQLVMDTFAVSFDELSRQTFDISAVVDNGISYVKTYTTNALDVNDIGELKNSRDYEEVLVQSRNRDVTLTIQNESYVPFKLVNWEVGVSEGGRRAGK
jgi:hypothetical protein